jgi:ABC-type transport system involved in multi-copper enzyme maturation permease subunit
MSIYKHHYRAYTGKVTPIWTRIFVLARYGFAEAWSSKITVVLFVVCLIPPVGSLFTIYLANNPAARLLMGNVGPRILAIDSGFFLNVLTIQSWLAMALASWIAPRLITLDLVDNALPILLSHPISRFGYVLGKYVALFAALSSVTWIPCLLLFAYQGYASPTPWAVNNLRIAGGMMAGAVIWIALISLLGLALSSWVKWRVLATGVIFAAILVPASVGAIVNAVLRVKWGFLLNLPLMMSSLWERLLGVHGRLDNALQIPPTRDIALMLALACCLFVFMLNTRIRAREVVRG